MRNSIVKYLVLTLTLLFAQSLLAKQYQVELIVFEHIYDTSSPEADSRVEMEIDYGLLRSLSSVDKEARVLNDEAQRIRGSRNFRYIGHASWIQEGLSRAEAGYVSLDDWLGSKGIRGSATVYLNRYLHLDVQLRKGSNQMNQKRRMRSKELHYIDHPQFGILAQITPVE